MFAAKQESHGLRGTQGVDFMNRLLFPALRHALPALLLVFGVTSTGRAQSSEKLPPGTKVVAVEATPTAIHLKHPFDYTQLLLTGTLNTGDKIDVTRLAQL